MQRQLIRVDAVLGLMQQQLIRAVEERAYWKEMIRDAKRRHQELGKKLEEQEEIHSMILHGLNDLLYSVSNVIYEYNAALRLEPEITHWKQIYNNKKMLEDRNRLNLLLEQSYQDIRKTRDKMQVETMKAEFAAEKLLAVFNEEVDIDF